MSSDFLDGDEIDYDDGLDYISPEDEEKLDHILDFLEEYTVVNREGPVWLTGSACHGPDYGDIDIVVQRGEKDLDDETITKLDDGVIYELLESVEGISIEEGNTNREQLIESDDVRVDTYREFELPINRYRFSMDDTEFDLTFSSRYPNDGGILMVPSHDEV